MRNNALVVAGLVLMVFLAGCESPGKNAPEKQQRGLDNMMAPAGGAFIGGRPGQGGGQFLGPGLSMMPATERGKALTTQEVGNYFRLQMAQHGSGRARVGAVTEKSDEKIGVEIVTQDGLPVAAYDVDRRTGIIRRTR